MSSKVLQRFHYIYIYVCASEPNSPPAQTHIRRVEMGKWKIASARAHTWSIYIAMSHHHQVQTVSVSTSSGYATHSPPIELLATHYIFVGSPILAAVFAAHFPLTPAIKLP